MALLRTKFKSGKLGQEGFPITKLKQTQMENYNGKLKCIDGIHPVDAESFPNDETNLEKNGGPGQYVIEESHDDAESHQAYNELCEDELSSVSPEFELLKKSPPKNSDHKQSTAIDYDFLVGTNALINVACQKSQKEHFSSGKKKKSGKKMKILMRKSLLEDQTKGDLKSTKTSPVSDAKGIQQNLRVHKKMSRSQPQFPRGPSKPKLHLKAKPACIQLFDQLSQTYCVSIGCLNCPQDGKLTHESCKANCILLDTLSKRTIVRQRPLKYTEDNSICERYLVDSKCPQGHACWFPHNSMEESLFQQDLNQEICITDLINDLRRTLLRVTCCVTNLQFQYGGRFDFACKICLSKEYIDMAGKQLHQPFCKGRHNWERNKTLVYHINQNVVEVHNPDKYVGDQYLLGMITIVESKVKEMLSTGFTIEDIVNEARRIVQIKQTSKQEHHTRGNKKAQHSFHCSDIGFDEYSHDNQSQFCHSSKCNTVTEQPHLDTYSDLESLNNSDDEEEVEHTNDLKSLKDPYYRLTCPSQSSQLMIDSPEKFKRCLIHLKSTSGATCYIMDTNEEIEIRGRMNCGPAFDGDEVLVQILQTKELDAESIVLRGRVVSILRKNAKRHGKIFVCRAGYYNGYLMRPLCGAAPKFHIIDSRVKHDYPKDFKNVVAVYGKNKRVKQFIKVDIENINQILFLVKYMKWSPEHVYPLGVVRGVIQAGKDQESSLQVLKLIHNVPKPEIWDVHSDDFEKTLRDCKGNREDFRDLLSITIDDETTTDIDDALSCLHHEDKNMYTIYVHIADVSEMIQKDDHLDNEALKRVCTIYNPGGYPYAPMIPRTLGQNLCSLIPNEERLAISVEMQLKPTGELISSRIHQSVIRSKAKLSYTKVQEFLDGTALVNYLDEDIQAQLLILADLAKKKRKCRLGGSMYSLTNLDNVKARYIVEEFMIEANKLVAEYLHSKYPEEAPFRVQMKPSPSRWADWKQANMQFQPLTLYFAQPHFRATDVQAMPNSEYHENGHESVPLLGDILKRSMAEINAGNIQGAADYMAFEKMHPQNALMMRSWFGIQNHAKYETGLSNEVEEFQHFSLKMIAYTHFTSPIRRYIDIVVQRLLKTALGNQACQYSAAEIDKICDEVNHRQSEIKTYDKKCELLQVMNNIAKQPSYMIAFIADVNDGEVELLIPGLPFADKSCRTIRFPQLGVNCKPDLAEDNSCVTLSWQRKLFDYNSNHPNSRTKQETKGNIQLDPSTYLRYVPQKYWIEAMEAISQEKTDDERKTAFLDVINKSLPHEKPSSFRREVTSEMKFPDKLVRHPCNLSYRLKVGNAVAVQVTAKPIEGLLQPYPQLCQLTPQVHLCLEHKKEPVTSFAKVAKKSSQKKYRNETEYKEIWHPILGMETAYCAVSDSDPIMVHNVPVQLKTVNKSIHGSFKMNYEFCRTRRLQLMKASKEEEFDEEELSDFLCIRCPYDESSPNKQGLHEARGAFWVGHAITIKKNTCTKETPGGGQTKEINVDFFINQSASESPPQRMFFHRINCTVEFLTKPLPNRRMEEAVDKLGEATELCKAVALGHRVPAIATGSYHKFSDSLDINIPSGSATRPLPKNNASQAGAIRRALNNNFTLIQGPPGTGKTITGIKLVYWYTQVNRKASRLQGNPQQQVLYCGPSNSAVDVVTAFLKERLGAKRCPKLVRVYSKAIEEQIYPIPRETISFGQMKTSYDAQSAECHKDVALHHLIRKVGSMFANRLQQFDMLFKSNAETPENVTDDQIYDYLELVKKASIAEMKKYEVILCTNSVSAGPRVVRGAKVGQIIIDEAGMCMEPETLIPLVSHAAKQIVLIGDHQQLRPIVRNEVTRKLGLEASLFERYQQDAVPLREQYRMHPQICEFPAKQFYPNVDLQTPFSSAWASGTPLRIWPRTEFPIVFCHVEGAEKSMTVSTSDGNEQSKSNEAEKDHAVRIFLEMVNQHHVNYRHISVLSQYKAQCTSIRNNLKGMGYKNPIVDTVVSAQGEEWDYVILSCVRSLPEYEIERFPSQGWLMRNLGFIIDYHQINVAITRARKGLIIIGNKNLIKCDHMWKDLLSHYGERGCIVDAEDFPRRITSRDHIRKNISANEARQKQKFQGKRS